MTSSSSSMSRSTSATSALGPETVNSLPAHVDLDLGELALHGAQQLVARAEQRHHGDVGRERRPCAGGRGDGSARRPRRRVRAGRYGRQSSWDKSTRPHRRSGARECRCSPGRPAERAAADDVQVGVEDALLGRRPGVGDEAVAGQALVGRRPARRARTTSASSPADAVARPARSGTCRRGHDEHVGRAPAGSMSRKARECSVSATTSAGMPPATIRQNRQSSLVVALMPRI